MKISASIYSDARKDLSLTVTELDAHQVDLFHVDCLDDPKVFEDIRVLRSLSQIPVDLHIITSTPSRFFPLLLEVPVEYVTFQVEPLEEPLVWPKELRAAKGIAITTPTPVDAFDAFSDCDFILIMATVPGQSGGVFDQENFKKIRTFRKRYPNKSIHVDGGVNGEVSFILRNMGVSTAVSGSYLFKGPSIGNALLNLTTRTHASAYKISDFMIPLDECPVVDISTCTTETILETIELGNLGFCLVTEANGRLAGIVSSADIRKALWKEIKYQIPITPASLVNKNPLTIHDSDSVYDMLRFLKKAPFPVMYLPVVDSHQHAAGVINFVNLIKGEL